MVVDNKILDGGNVIFLGIFFMINIFKQLKLIKNLVTKDITFSIVIQKGLIIAW
jgi:hypothetical protein